MEKVRKLLDTVYSDSNDELSGEEMVNILNKALTNLTDTQKIICKVECYLLNIKHDIQDGNDILSNKQLRTLKLCQDLLGIVE